MRSAAGLAKSRAAPGASPASRGSSKARRGGGPADELRRATKTTQKVGALRRGGVRTRVRRPILRRRHRHGARPPAPLDLENVRGGGRGTGQARSANKANFLLLS